MREGVGAEEKRQRRRRRRRRRGGGGGGTTALASSRLSSTIPSTPPPPSSCHSPSRIGEREWGIGRSRGGKEEVVRGKRPADRTWIDRFWFGGGEEGRGQQWGGEEAEVKPASAMSPPMKLQ